MYGALINWQLWIKVGVAIDTPMDFSRFNSATYLGCAYLGAMACCNGNFLFNISRSQLLFQLEFRWKFSKNSEVGKK